VSAAFEEFRTIRPSRRRCREKLGSGKHRRLIAIRLPRQ
jgi:hypothetical protein